MYSRKKKILYVHIPKTGGTSIESQSKIFQKSKKPVCDNGLLKHSLLAEHEKKMNSEDWKHAFKFTSIRNPYDRFYSYFQRHILGKRIAQVSDTRNNKVFNKWIKNHYSNVRIGTTDSCKLYDRADKSKQNVVDFNKVNKDIYHYYLVNDKGIIDIDYFVLFENLASDFDTMSEFVFSNRGVKLNSLKQRKHTAKRPAMFSYAKYWPESIEIFNDFNRADIELYSKIYQEKTGLKFKGLNTK